MKYSLPKLIKHSKKYKSLAVKCLSSFNCWTNNIKLHRPEKKNLLYKVVSNQAASLKFCIKRNGNCIETTICTCLSFLYT